MSLKTSPITSRSCDAQSADLSLLKDLPVEDDNPVFREPWEAQAFAIALVLYERRLLTWDEWAQALSAQIHAAQAQGDPALGNTYYFHCLAALQSLLSLSGVSSPEALVR